MSPLPFVITAAIVLVVDRLTKLAVIRRMAEFDSIPVIPGVFNLTYVRNPGAAFGLLPNRTSFFVFVSLVVIGLIVVFAGRFGRGNLARQVALGLILGGAIGNLWDRLHSGLVVDFLDFRVWPVFNIADSSLVIGVFLLAYLIIRSPGGEPGAGRKETHR